MVSVLPLVLGFVMIAFLKKPPDRTTRPNCVHNCVQGAQRSRKASAADE